MSDHNKKHVIVTAADKNYFSLLRGLIGSINKNVARSDIDVVVIDVGLELSQRDYLKQLVTDIIKVDWDIQFSFTKYLPEYRKAFVVTPFLPKYLLGYETILWIDADAWVQKGEAIDDLIAAAETGKLVVVPELDIAYPSAISRGKVRLFPRFPGLSGRVRRIGSWLRNGLMKRYGAEVANRNIFMPVLNAGVFAAKASSPSWEAWATAYRQAKIRKVSDLSDQFPLNFAVYSGMMSVYKLPATHNWICDLAMPLWHAKRGEFVSPSIPYQTIGIVHLLGDSKNKALAVKDTDGEDTGFSLRYPETPMELNVSD